ncbi:unknown protein [Seminavis robusta]|uniref:Disease resistance R13L4/SHOC-2-like LRR domain-containing protein n=1 Tax=Seminavis robusta TaxID=568900 RepID=A0A9N8HPL2_9STRA|nr:unknown protein [Seminavis robusta]|eukprot:Sro1339_g264281.1  (948) ;mRNA; r:11242-14138
MNDETKEKVHNDVCTTTNKAALENLGMTPITETALEMGLPNEKAAQETSKSNFGASATTDTGTGSTMKLSGATNRIGTGVASMRRPEESEEGKPAKQTARGPTSVTNNVALGSKKAEAKSSQWTRTENAGNSCDGSHADSALTALTGMAARFDDTRGSGQLSFFPKEIHAQSKGLLAENQTEDAKVQSNHNAKENVIDSTFSALSAAAARLDGTHECSGHLSFFRKKSAVQQPSETIPIMGETASSRMQDLHQMQQPGEATATCNRLLATQPPPQPGAYRNTPGESLQHVQCLNYDLLRAAVDHPPSAATFLTPTQPDVGQVHNPTPPQPSADADNELAVANLVAEESVEQVRQSATPFVDQLRQREQKKKRLRELLILLMLILLIGGAIAVGTVIGTQKQKALLVSVNSPTATPTIYRSMEPSGVPSSSPTGVLDLLLHGLPNYSVASINNGSKTPQWKAWQWLANHENVSKLSEWRKEQLFPLATFFYAFEGEGWPTYVQERWMDDAKEECDWFSSGFGFFNSDGSYVEWPDQVGPCNSQEQFTSLYIEELQLSDHLPFVPNEIIMLTSLVQLRLGLNQIGIPVSSLLPKLFYKMTALTYLALGKNELTGQLPSLLGQLAALEFLELNKNQFTGQIPCGLEVLTALKRLDLGGNHLTGPISSKLGHLTALGELSLNGNQFTGLIPTELESLTGLWSLQLDRNELTSELPSELGSLISLKYLEVGENMLTGPIPSELGQLFALKVLELHENQVSGKMTSELGQLTGLKWCWLHRNLISGNITTELGQLTRLRELKLGENQLSHQIPSELGQLAALKCLQLHDNELTGQIPSDLGKLAELVQLRLDGNQLVGQIPSMFGELESVTELHLDGNQLTGKLPYELQDLSALGFLNVSGNFGLSGSIPDKLCFLQDASCTYYGPEWEIRPCFLGFDCTSRLCGCDCACSYA